MTYIICVKLTIHSRINPVFNKTTNSLINMQTYKINEMGIKPCGLRHTACCYKLHSLALIIVILLKRDSCVYIIRYQGAHV